MLQNSRNLGTSLRNISNAIEKAVGKFNDPELTRSANKSSFHSNQAATSSRGRGNSALAQIKDQEYERQKDEKQQRANRLKEARRKYSKRKTESALGVHNHSDAKERSAGNSDQGISQASSRKDSNTEHASDHRDALARYDSYI